MLTRRRLFASLPPLAAGLAQAAKKPAGTGRYIAYVGTYTGTGSKGIQAFRWDPRSAKIDQLGLVGEIVNPSFVAIHPNRKYLYSVSELGNNGAPKGSVAGFSIDSKTGMLTKLNAVSSRGGGACHLVVDATGRNLLVANYGSGSVASIRVEPDGRLGESTAFDQHSGSSVDKKRQEGPHAHAVVLSPDNRFLFVPDLGLDKIFIYRFDADKGTLAPNDPPYGVVPPGAGPRHFAFHPSAKFAYSVNEMGSSVTAFRYDAKRGSLTPIETVSTLPKGFTGQDDSAEIAVDAAGKFLYASNRGNDSITAFAIDPGKGTLTTVQNVSTEGKAPRNFRIDPTGNYLFAESQDSNKVVLFKRDKGTGRLTPAGQTFEIIKPVCIQFLAV
ncbi:MAG: lactonase family protein [Acidobacteriota bacterium]|nr:lactonase family protein [Acidobacteriota bacterium]